MPEQSDPTPNADQAAYWNSAGGETWAVFQDTLDRELAPLGRAAIAALGPAAGERILDIGCGAGATALAMAEQVAPSGQVVGLDLSRPLLALARRRAAAAGLSNVEFIEGDAQAHALPPASFDAAFSRFGVMFFADPTAAFAHIRGALRLGGRLAFVCWRGMAENDWVTVPTAAALRHLTFPPPGDPLAPGPFAFADPARVTAILSRAGFEDIAIRGHDEKIGWGDLDESVSVALNIGPLGRMLRDEPDKRDLVLPALREAFAPYAGADGVMMNSATWIVTARKR
ncbi:MAG: class I SAM-dependent methyltransferase [Caulobacterales bacterium]